MQNASEFAVGASMVVGIGVVEGTECMIVANDPTVKGGALNPYSLRKSFRAAEIAERNWLPTINLTESGGADLPTQKDIFIPGGKGFRDLTRASARKQPTISVVFGNSTAGGAYIPGMSDYVVMVDVNEASYPDQHWARHLLHIGVTRAAHQLWLVSTGEPSPLIPAALAAGKVKATTVPCLVRPTKFSATPTTPCSVSTGYRRVTATVRPFLWLTFALAFSWVSVLVGVLAADAEKVQVFGFTVLFPVTFVSNVFVPAETLPGWLEAFVNVNPVSILAAASRGLLLGGPVATPVIQSLLWAAAIAAVFAPLSVRALKRKV